MPKFTEQLKKSTSLITTLANTSMEFLLEKAKNATKKESYKYYMPRKSIIAEYDEGYGYNGLYKEKGSLVSFDVLRQISEKDMIVRAIIGKFCNRVAAFAQPQKNKYSLGFIVRPNQNFNPDQLDEKKELDETDLENIPGEGKLSPDQKKEIDSIVNFLMKTGIDSDDRPIEDRKSFETFLRLITNDRLIYNQIAIECIPTKDGKTISYFMPVNGGTIRFSSPNITKNEGLDQIILNRENFTADKEQEAARRKRIEDTDADDIKYVQVYRGQVYATFTHEDLIYRQGIPSSEIIYNGYSPGELEFLLNTVANHRIAESHNESFFRFGYANNGILNIKSDLTQEDLEGIKRAFQRQYQGSKNAFKMPIMSSKDGLEWIQTGQSNKDMEWGSWMEYLIKIITGVYGMSPAEINFDITKNSSSSLGDGGQRNEVMLRDTRNSMLRPLLRWIESIINDDLLPRFDKDLSKKYVFEFVGLEHEDKDAELTRIEKQVKNYRTINEVRKEEGLDELEFGNIILDANYLSYAQGQNISNGNKNQKVTEDNSEFDDYLNDKNEEDEIKQSIDANIKNFFGNDIKKAQDCINDLNKTPKLLKVEWYNRES